MVRAVIDSAPLHSDAPTLPNDDFEGALPPRGPWGRYVVVGRLGAGGMGIVLAALDPALDRMVALKLLRPRHGVTARDGAARLGVEAQAMARLAHPNVVTVFEVGQVGDLAFVAMELVEGQTLRAWLHARPRPWREIVAMFGAAGRGLAAAHAAGLVHRDFKPDNVLLGSDGRPRVSDFGLVRHAGDDAEPPAVPPGADAMLRSCAIGTPAYLSPEQWAGRPVDARSDQFAFCVALWEALWGRRPFQGASSVELRAAIRAGALVEPPRRPRVPRRLQAALRRGLAIDPAARWPDLPALLAELARAVAGRRRTAIAMLALAAAIVPAAIAVAALTARSAADSCALPAGRLAAVWSPVQRDAVRAKLAAADPVQGASRFTKIAAVFDAGAGGWGAMYVEACRATRVDRSQPDALLDRRMECLDRWLGELADTVGVAAQAGDRAAVDHAIHAAMGLSPLAVCADRRVLSGALPPPADPARRQAAEALMRRAQEIDVARRAGAIEGLSVKARAVVAEARPLDHAPTLAAALRALAWVDFAVGDDADAGSVLRELTQVAARARDARSEAFAWANLVMTLGYDQGKPDEAIGLVPVAAAAVLRAGDAPDLRFDLLYAHATVLDRQGHQAEELVLLNQARDLLEHAGAAAPGSPLAKRRAQVMSAIGGAQALLGEGDAANASYHDAIERFRALYGVDSPDEAASWHDLAVGLGDAGRYGEALAAFRIAARIREARLGDSWPTADSLFAVAAVLDHLGQWDQALATFDRVLRLQRGLRESDEPVVAGTQVRRGLALVHLGRLDEAAAEYRSALASFEHHDANSFHVAYARYLIGELNRQRGRCQDAQAEFARSTELAGHPDAPDPKFLIYPLVGEAACLIRGGQFAPAIARLDRALQLRLSPRYADQVALARSWLGRAQVEARRDVAGGLAMARAARPAIAADPNSAGDLRELDAWLAGIERSPKPRARRPEASDLRSERPAE